MRNYLEWSVLGKLNLGHCRSIPRGQDWGHRQDVKPEAEMILAQGQILGETAVCHIQQLRQEYV